MIPYGKQHISSEDVAAVIDVLKSDWLTSGPAIELFEKDVAEYTNTSHAVAFCNGTAALHGTMYALGIGEGDEVITSPMTFAASANCIVYQRATPIFADINPQTLLIDPQKIEARITSKTKAVITVDYAGQACEYDKIVDICERYSLALVSDGCHALGGRYGKKKIGSIANMTAFSFHPVKHITTGEGGMVTTKNETFAIKLRQFRNHGINTDFRTRDKVCSWIYEMVDLGYNYRITDLQCALGVSQLKNLDYWIEQRNLIASRYSKELVDIPGITPLKTNPNTCNAYHLYVIKINPKAYGRTRAELFKHMRSAGIGVNVHYIPVYLHPYYKNKFSFKPGLCPITEEVYEQILSIPIYPDLREEEQDYIIKTLREFAL